MNPLIETQLERLNSQIADLGKVLDENEGDLKIERAEKDELRQGQWEARQKSATLQRIEKEHDELLEDHAKLTKERKILRDGLSKILAFVKLVDGGLRP